RAPGPSPALMYEGASLPARGAYDKLRRMTMPGEDTRMKRSRIAMAVSIAALLGAQEALAETFDIKTGLWETTTTSTMTGVQVGPMAVNESELAKMAAEQRERMKAMLKRMQGEPTTRTTRSCVTQEQIEKDRLGETEEHCTRTVIEKTKRLVHMKIA